MRGYVIAFWFLAAGHAFAQGVANGVFLVAQPSLIDSIFGRSVVLITQPASPRPGGPMGVIINKPSDVPLARVFPKHPRIAALPARLHIGGPVARQTLVFLVRSAQAPPRAMRVLDDVFLTGDVDWVESALGEDNPPSEVRVFSGYAGWAPGQLQNELDREGWYMLPASADVIFGDGGQQLWHDLLKRAMLRSTSASRTPQAAMDVKAAGRVLSLETP